MAYDLLIKNGRIVDGSGMPAFRGDVGVKDGKIAEIGKLSGPATRTIDAAGRVVAPGFIDNHCHYDAQVTWDPLCSFSCDHGATSVIFGNCSLSLAPVRKGSERRLSEFLSYVEAIPMEVLDTLEFTWETFPEYLGQMDHHLGVNVGNLIGHTAVRYYVMGDDCQKRTATDDEIKQMQDLVRDGMKAGALGVSVSRNQGHFDPQGVHIPAIWADEKEIFAIGDVLRELGTGLIQIGRRQRRRDEGRADEPALRGDRPRRRLQQSRPDDAPAGPVAEADGPGRRDDRQGHPRLSDVHAKSHHRLFHDAEHADLPRDGGVAPDLSVLAGRDAEGLCRSRNSPEASRGGDRIQERAGDRHLQHLVGLHGVADRGPAEEQAVRGQDRSARSPRRRARASSTPSSISRSRRTSTPNGCTARTMSMKRLSPRS